MADLRFLLAALLLAGTACTPPAPLDAAARSVIVISIDTLRADHLGVYGYHRPTSPNLDALAREGVLFEDATSASPWTLPAHASLLSGVYPPAHRAVEGNQAISSSVPLAAEIFHDGGFRTGGFVASWFVSRRYGFERGFETFEDFGITQSSNNRDTVQADQVMEAAAGWLKGVSPRERFFLFVHLYDPHFNYQPPPEHAARFDTGYRGPREKYRKYSYYFDHPLPAEQLAQEVALYDGEIHYVDSQIRKFLDAVAAQGHGDDTLVVITSDHGEEFFERGSWGHAHTLYQEQLQVPLIFHGAGLPPGRRVAHPVRHVDVLPTLMDAADLPVPPDIHGASFWHEMGGALPPDRTPEPAAGAGPAPRPAYMETSRNDTSILGVRRDQWKLIRDLRSGTRELYDLEADPGERRNLAGSEPERAAAMDAELTAVAVALVPDRWLIRWFAPQDGPLLSGRLTTGGTFLAAGSRGTTGQVRMDPGQGGVSFSLPPAAVLEAVVVPVDAPVTLEAPHSSGAPAAVVLGREARVPESLPVTVSADDGPVVAGLPTPLPPAVAFWLEQTRGGGSAVQLSEDDIRRLESLGYVMR